MSQQLLPVNNGVGQVVSNTTSPTSQNVFSPQYVIANSLQPRPTEWVPGGRPIYRRLPATSETYQIDFFNIVSPPNTAVRAELENIGYVYVPFTENSEGPTSIFVSASDNREDLIIRGGRIVWQYGGTTVYPALINLDTLQVGPGTYFLAYELIYDDSVEQKVYTMTDFALTGQPLTITSSTDSVTGWRYPAVNAFLNTTNNFWTSEDTYFPSFAQPTESYLQWESELGSAYSNIVLRCPSGVTSTATATLFYISSGGVVNTSYTVGPSLDSTGQYYEFQISSPTFNTGWKVEWSNVNIKIQSITVSGALTLERKPVTPATQASLVLYPENITPTSPTFCPLAKVTVNNSFKVANIQDIRYVIRRDYVPVSDWLTKFFDENLINLYEQVYDYSNTWMAPPTALKQEYAKLETQNILIV